MIFRKSWLVWLVLLAGFAALAFGDRGQARANQSQQAPGKEDFEWQESTPGQQGIDEAELSKIDPFVRQNYPNIYSVLIVRHGRLVYEQYYQGRNRASDTPVFSVTKSLISALIGIALREGYLTSLDQRIADFMPEYFGGNGDPLKRTITIRDALTMTGGLEPTDKNINAWLFSADWFQYALERPLQNRPGETFSYNTGLAHLLSGVLTRATGMSTKNFADQYLLKPLGITNYRWQADPKGYYGGGHGLFLTPRDMAKFGYLYLRNGNWFGRQLIPEDWVKQSTRKHLAVDSLEGYGYLWWNFDQEDVTRGRSFPAYAASGMGGQLILVVPALDMVVVISADAEQRFRGNDPQELVGKMIMPAVR
jgi:CubicO group peptidase (beta-lactamase class C family)